MKTSVSAFAATVAAVALALHGDDSAAAPCAGFIDVDTSSGFCQNVEWIRNRKVTLGCSIPQSYCPGEPVSRLQMAAFMNRLGTALTPVVVRLDAVSGALDLNLAPVVCQSAPQAITDFPRRAVVDATFSGTAATGVDVAMRVVWSSDGVTWLPLSTAQSVTFVPAAQWSSASDLGTLDLAVGATARFGVQVSRNGAGVVNLVNSRCQLRASIQSRDGAASPF